MCESIFSTSRWLAGMAIVMLAAGTAYSQNAGQPRRIPPVRSDAARNNARPAAGVRNQMAPRGRVDQARRSVQPRVNRVAQQYPQGFPLSKEAQARVDQILNYWEKNTSGIKTYQTKFRRTSIDTVFGKEKVEQGTIRYRAPDKGLMRVERIFDAVVKDGKKTYAENKELEFGEYWVCDGEAIFQFESRTKTLTETHLPAEMQGKSIGEGPLPFMFGAKAEKMKQRYWIREVKVPNNDSGDYYLEAIPKRQADAANFDKLLVRLSLAGKSLMPAAMRLTNKQGRIDYEFQGHKTNDPRHRVAGFLDSFVSPKLPRGWKKVVEDWEGNRLDRQAERRGRETAQPRR